MTRQDVNPAPPRSARRTLSLPEVSGPSLTPQTIAEHPRGRPRAVLASGDCLCALAQQALGFLCSSFSGTSHLLLWGGAVPEAQSDALATPPSGGSGRPLLGA